MKIDVYNNIVRLTAEEGMALKRVDDTGEYHTSTEVWLSDLDSPDNWEDCEYREEPISFEET